MEDPHEEKLKRFRVLDLETCQFNLFTGYTDGTGRTFVDAGNGEKRVSYVNLGDPVGDAAAAYIFRGQLEQDPGLYNFNRIRARVKA